MEEHHLGETNYLTSTKGIEFWKGVALWNHNISMGRLQRLSIGTSTMVDRSLTPEIISNDILLEGRTQFITL